jgi:hypothetical protein
VYNGEEEVAGWLTKQSVDAYVLNFIYICRRCTVWDFEPGNNLAYSRLVLGDLAWQYQCEVTLNFEHLQRVVIPPALRFTIDALRVSTTTD